MDIVGMMWMALRVVGLGCGIVLMLAVLVALIILFKELVKSVLRDR